MDTQPKNTEEIDVRTFAGVEDVVEVVSNDPNVREMVLGIFGGDYSFENVTAKRPIGDQGNPQVMFPWNDADSGLKIRTDKKREVFERQIMADAKEAFDRADRRVRKQRK